MSGSASPRARLETIFLRNGMDTMRWPDGSLVAPYPDDRFPAEDRLRNLYVRRWSTVDHQLAERIRARMRRYRVAASAQGAQRTRLASRRGHLKRLRDGGSVVPAGDDTDRAIRALRTGARLPADASPVLANLVDSVSTMQVGPHLPKNWLHAYMSVLDVARCLVPEQGTPREDEQRAMTLLRGGAPFPVDSGPVLAKMLEWCSQLDHEPRHLPNGEQRSTRQRRTLLRPWSSE